MKLHSQACVWRWMMTTLACVILAGCAATPYQRIGSKTDGGYSSIRHAKDTYTVTFSGNEYSAQDRVYDFALLRAAELTIECNFTHFVLLDDRDASRTSTRYISGSPGYSIPTTRYTASGTPYTTSTYIAGTPSSISTSRNPAYSVRIKMTNEPDGPTSLIYDAKETAARLRAKHKLDAQPKL